MSAEVALLVSDVPPLITLAAAERLAYLLLPKLPVIIPDAVFYEATRQTDKLGAQQILDWCRAEPVSVRIAPTEIFKNEIARLSVQGGRMTRDLGERAAIEVIRDYPLGQDGRAILLTDDRDVERVVMVDRRRIIPLTTWDYLSQLEQAQRIQSADAVLEAARQAGRPPATYELWGQHDAEIRNAVRAVIERVHREPGPGA